jgi:hypothetical protein
MASHSALLAAPWILKFVISSYHTLEFVRIGRHASSIGFGNSCLFWWRMWKNESAGFTNGVNVEVTGLSQDPSRDRYLVEMEMCPFSLGSKVEKMSRFSELNSNKKNNMTFIGTENSKKRVIENHLVDGDLVALQPLGSRGPSWLLMTR